MLLIKIGMTLIVSGLPLFLIGAAFGYEHPTRMNAADCLGVAGMLLLFLGAICGAIGCAWSLVEAVW